MTQHTDLLQTLAQIFIAFAGFAGVVAAFSEIRLAPEATAFRVRLMVAVALLMLVAALVPLVLDAANLPSGVATRLSASFFASGAIALAIWSWQLVQPLYREGKLDTQTIAAVWYVITVSLIIGLFAVGAGFVQRLAPVIYLGSLFFGIVLCSYYFLMLMFAIKIKKSD